MAEKQRSIDSQYQSLGPDLQRLEVECRYIIEASLLHSKIKTHSVLSRVKKIESVREKCSRKEIEGTLDDIDDLLGLRIVCLLRSDIKRIGDLIREEFDVSIEDNKIDGATVEGFGYQSVHFIAKLKTSCAGPRYTGLHKQHFEIQLRTIAMDAWASLSHHLDYKNEADVPKDLRKDFFALSGLFYVADTHFEMFYEARQKSSESAKAEMAINSFLNQELNLDTLAAFLEKKYPHRDPAPLDFLSLSLQELIECGYTSLKKIDALLNKSNAAFTAFEEDYPVGSHSGFKYGRLGVLRLSIAMIDPAYAEKTMVRNNRFTAYLHLIKQG